MTELKFSNILKKIRGFKSQSIYDVFVYFISSIPVIRFVVDWRNGLDYLFYQYLVDDAFYYFEISKHIPYFNDGIANSGFHPIYAFLISPLHSFLNYQIAIPLSLFILVFSLSISTLLVYKIVSLYWNKDIGFLSALAWGVSPLLYNISLSGVETTLATAIALFYYSRFAVLDNEKTDLRNSHFFVLSIIFGVSFWARMDTPIILAPSILYMFFVLIPRGNIKTRISLSLPAILIPIIWLAYIYSQTKSLIPTSGLASKIIYGSSGKLIVSFEQMSNLIIDTLFRMIDFFIGLPRDSLILTFLFFFLGIFSFVSIIFRKDKSKIHQNRNQFVLLVVSGILIWGSYYVLYQGILRPWYYSHLSLVIFLVYLPTVISYCGRIIINPAKRLLGKKPFTTIIGISYAFLSIFSHKYMAPVAPQEYDKFKSALAVNYLVDELNIKSNIGSYNTGIFDYFTNIDIINLDGVVNPEVLEAHLNGNFADYLAHNDIQFFLEHERLGIKKVERFNELNNVQMNKFINLSNYYERFNTEDPYTVYLWKVTTNNE